MFNKLARAARKCSNISLICHDFFQKFLTTRNKLARAARKFFEYIIVSHDVNKEILNKLARAARENF